MQIVFSTALQKIAGSKLSTWEVRVRNSDEKRGAVIEVVEAKDETSEPTVRKTVIARGVHVGKPHERTPLRIAMLKAHDMIVKKRNKGFIDSTT